MVGKRKLRDVKRLTQVHRAVMACSYQTGISPRLYTVTLENQHSGDQSRDVWRHD